MTVIRRILSIDGGGIKGVFPAAFLATLEDAIGERIANYFDLIVGTSTGGILALGLGLGLSATEILSFYEQYGPQIFQQGGGLGWLRHLIFAKYSDAMLRQALEETFGDLKLGESNQRLVIPSLNLDKGEAYLYKTAHHPRFERDYKELAVTVALATSAAPTFFPTHLSEGGTAFIDGGVWANNPAVIAMIEAVKTLQWNPDTVRLLSLGCSTPPVSVGWERWLPFGKIGWAPKIVEMFMAGQSSFSLGAAQLFAGEKNVLRIDPIVQRNRFVMDGANNILILKGLGQSEARKELPKLRQLFLTEPAPTFVPEWQLEK